MALFCYRDQWSLVDLMKLSSYAESRYLDMEPCPDNAGPCCFDLFQLALVEARQLTNILVVVMMAVLCIGSLHRTSSLLDIWRHCKYIWLLAVLAAAALQVRRAPCVYALFVPLSSLSPCRFSFSLKHKHVVLSWNPLNHAGVDR